MFNAIVRMSEPYTDTNVFRYWCKKNELLVLHTTRDLGCRL